MVAADDVAAVLLAWVPAQAPAAVDMAVVAAPDREDSADERDLADVRPDAAPKLVAEPAERVRVGRVNRGRQVTPEPVAERREQQGCSCRKDRSAFSTLPFRY